MPFFPNDKESLPEACQAYWEIIRLCVCHSRGSKPLVAYLTIDESNVEEGKVRLEKRPLPTITATTNNLNSADSQTQRRGGLHTETPGVLVGSNIAPRPEFAYHHWGQGYYNHGRVEGGLYMASNVANSTLFYDAEVRKDRMRDVPNGDCRYLRKVITDVICRP